MNSIKAGRRTLILLALWTLTSATAFAEFATTLTSMPENETEYRHIFGALPKGGQMDNVRSANADTKLNTTRLKTKNDLMEQIITNHSQILVIIGHNDNGKFYLPSGEHLAIVEISALAELHNKFPIFLSCKSQSHTSFPGTLKLLDYKGAFKIAKDIDTYFSSDNDTAIENHPALTDLLQRENRPTDMLSPSSPSISSSAKQCKDLFSNVATRSIGKIELSRNIKSIIRSHEVRHPTSSIAIQALAAGLAVTLSADNQNK